jgi:hypothetical protein
MALAVQREKQQRHKVNAEADSNETRTCLDKRTARLRYGKDFKADVLQHRQQHPRLNNGTNHSDKAGSQIHDRSLNGVSIVVRKRPIFDFEQSRGDYDVVSIDNSSSTMDTCIIDNCVMHPDMKTKLVKPLFFPAQAAFDEHCSNDDIYKNIAEPLVNNTVKEGVVATLLLYGQTGNCFFANHSLFYNFKLFLIIFYVIPTSPRMWQILYHVWDRGEDSERDLPSHCFSTCFK